MTFRNDAEEPAWHREGSGHRREILQGKLVRERVELGLCSFFSLNPSKKLSQRGKQTLGARRAWEEGETA